MLIDTIETIAGAITAIAAAAAAIFAWRGLQTWREEMLGRRRAELAEGVQVLAYEAQDAIAAAQSPLVLASEMVPQDGQNAEYAKENVTAPARRLLRDKKIFADLRARRYEFIAIFGRDAAQPFDTFFDVRNDIIYAADELFDLRHSYSDFAEERNGCAGLPSAPVRRNRILSPNAWLPR